MELHNNNQTYIEKLNNRLSCFFDIHTQPVILGKEINLFAKSVIHNEKYFASKSIKLWRVENYEYVFVKCYPAFSQIEFDNLSNFLKEAMDIYVKPQSEHMESIITGIIVTEQEPDLHTQSLVTTFKYRRSYRLTLYGWSEIRLILVIPSLNKGICNKRGKEVLNFYLPECHKSSLKVGIQKLKTSLLNR